MIFIYIILVVFLFGALVFIHEFGHFITAKLSGVRVNEFAIGMGPAFFKKQVGETLYALRFFPFGGFCAMEGEDRESDDPRSFGSKHVLIRILIVLAGSAMNLIAGFIVLAIFFAPIKEWNTPIVSNVVSEHTLPENALCVGDIIKSIDGYKVYIFSDVSMGFMRGGVDGSYDIEVVRNGKNVMLKDVRVFSGNGDLSLNDKGSYQIDFVSEKSTLAGKTKFVIQNGFNLVRLVKIGLGDLISGSVSKDDISGPIGIGQIMVDTAKVDLHSLFYLLAFISINLGIMNMLPLPALDGGRFIFLVIELIFRKPVPQKYEAIIHAAGIVVLMGLMLLVTFNDIVKLFA